MSDEPRYFAATPLGQTPLRELSGDDAMRSLVLDGRTVYVYAPCGSPRQSWDAVRADEAVQLSQIERAWLTEKLAQLDDAQRDMEASAEQARLARWTEADSAAVTQGGGS